MTRTIVAVYESLYAANQAVQELFEIGFSEELIDIAPRLRTKLADQLMIPITGAPDAAASRESIEPVGDIDSAAWAEARLMNKQPKGTLRPEVNIGGQSLGMWIGLGVGAALGLTGALFNALGVLHLPLPALPHISGALGEWLNGLALSGAGAAAGVISGGAIGGMLGLNIPEEEVRRYAKNVREGDVVVTILADWDSIDPAMQIVQKYGPLEVREHPVSSQVSGYLIAASQPVYLAPRRFNSRPDDQERR